MMLRRFKSIRLKDKKLCSLSMLWNELLRLFFYIGIAIPVEEYFDSHTTAVGGSAGQSEEVEIDFSPCT
jgi:hypothetical protein